MRYLVLLGCAVGLAVPLHAQADGLHVRTGNRDTVIPWVTSNGARFLPLKSLATVLGGSVRTSARTILLDACGVVSRFVIGQRSVEIDGAGMESLPAAVTAGGISGTLIPVEFITDVLPRYGTGIVWDADERELRRG